MPLIYNCFKEKWWWRLELISKVDCLSEFAEWEHCKWKLSQYFCKWIRGVAGKVSIWSTSHQMLGLDSLQRTLVQRTTSAGGWLCVCVVFTPGPWRQRTKRRPALTPAPRRRPWWRPPSPLHAAPPSCTQTHARIRGEAALTTFH